ncbi:Ribonuclease H [Yarrowia sp. B02]|nr:Ribonuclease H [Yarrowia sp. B02]
MVLALSFVQGYSNPDWKGFNVWKDALDYLKGAPQDNPSRRGRNQGNRSTNGNTSTNGNRSTNGQPKRSEEDEDADAYFRESKADADEKGRKLQQADQESKDTLIQYLRAKRELDRLAAEVRDVEIKVRDCTNDFIQAKDITEAMIYAMDDGEKKYFVVGDYIFNNSRVAEEQRRKTGEGVYGFSSREMARIAASTGPDRTYKEISEQTISYVNDQGKRIYKVFTDGACERNGTPDALGGLGVYFGDYSPWNFCGPLLGYDEHSNQLAELLAIEHAYLRLRNMKKYTNTNRQYEVYTDSSYAINCLTKWCHTWVNNGWKTTDGSPVKHQDVIERILEDQKDKDCRHVLGLRKVKAHSDSEGNNKADKLATEGIYINGGKYY